MKNIRIMAVSAALALTFLSCSGCKHAPGTEIVSQVDPKIAVPHATPIDVTFIDSNTIDGISESHARELCEESLGTVDETTGYPYSYVLQDAFEYQGQQYRVFDMRWKMDDGRTSHIQCVMVSANGEEILVGDWIRDETYQTVQYFLY